MSHYQPQQVQRFINETPKTIAGLIVISAIIIYTYIDYVPLDIVLLWSLSQSIFIFFRFYNFKKLQKYLDSHDNKNLKKHINYLALMIAYSAISWNAALIFWVSYSPPYFELISTVIIVGLITAASQSLSSIFKIFVTYYFTLLIPFVLFISSYDTQIHNSLLLLYLLYMIFTFSIAKSTKDSLWSAIEDNIKLEENEVLLYKKSKDLELAKDKAEKSEKIKSEFLANMSHEIRTPMNGIIGMTYLTLQTQLSHTQKNYIEKIQSSAKGLLGIINDILDSSKIEAGKLEIVKVDFTIDSVVDNLKNIIEIQANEKGLAFDVTYEKNRVFYGDSLRISQVLINLSNNAIKFTSKGKIDIDIKLLAENRIRFEVKDTGIGLSIEQQSKLFQSFSQADASTTKKYGGTGLGLSISKQLVELMDGKIWCESQEGVGSRFIFEIELPLGNRDNIEQISTKQIDIQRIATLKNSHILLVEDNKINQEIILGLLKNSGIIIDIANNGEEAVERFKESEYELILMDLQMPIMDGYQATKIIRDSNKKIPIIALTANAMREDIEKTQAVGMNEHLNKPIDIEKLYTTLLKYISKKIDTQQIQQEKKDAIELPNFISIDTESGLKHLAGNKTLYIKILKDFYTDYKNLDLESLQQDEYKRVVHTIKGLSANIGTKALNKATQELEEKQTKEFQELFYIQLHKILDELKVLDKDTKIQIEQSKDSIQITDVLRDELFLKLKEAIATKQPKKCEPIIEEIDEYKLSNRDKELFDKIKGFIKKYRFNDAILLIESFKN